MNCPKCNYSISDGSQTCFNCGAYIGAQGQYQYPQYSQFGAPPIDPHAQARAQYQYASGEDKSSSYRTIGIILILIGAIFLPIAFLTLDPILSWGSCLIGFVCLMAGIISIATNLRSKVGPPQY